MDNTELLNIAKTAMQNSYSPYSNFKVGAAILTTDDKVFTGCNIENASYSPSLCAERTAIAKAVSEGYTNFSGIAIYGTKNPCYPCGVCRQVLSEFCDSDLKIIIADKNGNVEVHTMSELLPHSFKL